MDDTTQSVLEELRSIGQVYLASPLRADHPNTKQARIRSAKRAAGWITRNGVAALSPVAHSIALEAQAKRDGSPIEQGYEDLWQGVDATLLDHSSALVILTLPDWEKSEGVSDEIHRALDNKTPIFLANQTPAENQPYKLLRAPYSTEREEAYVEIQNELFTQHSKQAEVQ